MLISLIAKPRQHSEENLEKFTAQLRKIAAKKIDKNSLIPKLKIEAVLDFSDINLQLAEEIAKLAPYGQNNPQPRFVTYGVRVDDVMTMGFDNQHIKIRFSKINNNSSADSFWGISFGAAEEYKYLKPGDRVDLVYYLEINEFNGRREAQLKIIDIKKSW